VRAASFIGSVSLPASAAISCQILVGLLSGRDIDYTALEEGCNTSAISIHPRSSMQVVVCKPGVSNAQDEAGTNARLSDE